MKIKTDFVTNSSSSSRDDIEKLIKKEVQVHHIEECWMNG